MSASVLRYPLALAALLLLGCPRPGGSDAGSNPDAGSPGCAAGCPSGERCLRDACYPAACAETACGPDEVCDRGACVASACAGLRCPAATVCLRGQCFDTQCGERACAQGEVCEGARCVEASCAGVSCGEGTACRAGQCTECLEGFVRVDGGCAAPRPAGQACADAAECETGVCAGGRCCLTPCLGQCEGCDEGGQCRSLGRGHPGAPPCFPGRCGGERLSCIEDCVTDGDCAAGAFCDRAGPTPRCLPALARGAACARPAQCASGFCEGGACCDRACTAACESCNGLTSDGLPTGLTPGTCSPAPLGATPRSDATCGPTLCDGVALGCPATCASDSSCLPRFWCGGASAPTCANLQQGNGTACDRPRQCASGFCVDGVCCGGACTGDCQACNLPGQEGLCAGETGTRSRDGGYCADGFACQRPCDDPCDRCQSNGTCSRRTDNGRLGVCGNFACRAGADAGCHTTCTPGTQQGCLPGMFCEAAQPPRCRLQQPSGAPCDAGAQCVGGACCAGSCTNVSQDPWNCGACGTVCTYETGGDKCEGGSCCAVCDGYTCVDLRITYEHCGWCGNDCSWVNAESCSVGLCCVTCGEARCVDLMGDPGHCGACGVICPEGTNCLDGSCQ